MLKADFLANCYDWQIITHFMPMPTLIAKEVTGLVHATNGGSCSWHEFAAEIFRLAGVAADLSAMSSAEFGAPARRPGYSVLACRRLADAGVPMRPWQEALAAYLQERAKK